MKRELIIATCQFPITADIKKNTSYILKQMDYAKIKKADVAHYPECCLSGYAGVDFNNFNRQHDMLLNSSLEMISKYAEKLKMWIILGSHYFENRNKKPYNCLWLINDKGKIVDRYDKRFLMGSLGELEHYYYKPGRRAVIFKIRNIKCGLLICHEWRYPEVYREYEQRGTELIFQSFYDGNLNNEKYEQEGKNFGSLVPGTVRGSAANNYFWISASNTCKKESSFANFVVQPDGSILHKLKRNISGVLISKINCNKKFMDPSRSWRARAAKGIMYSG